MNKDIVTKLIVMANEARNNSYCPYSSYSVGAALLTKEGEVITGVNVENASYGATICAERGAIMKAVSMGYRKFDAIAIVGGKMGEKSTSYAYPCGVCRQVLREFTDPEKFQVIVAIDDELYEAYTLNELLPHSFGPEQLDV